MTTSLESLSSAIVELLKELNDPQINKLPLEKEMLLLLQSMQESAKKATELFLKYDKTSKIKTLFDKISQPTVDPQSLSESDYYLLLDLATFCYKIEKFDDALSMTSYIVALFPHYIQPYLILADLAGICNGIEVALQIYEFLINNHPHPLVYACAANCLAQTEDTDLKNHAKQLYQEALNMLSHPEFSEFSDIKPDIDKNLKKLIL